MVLIAQHPFLLGVMPCVLLTLRLLLVVMVAGGLAAVSFQRALAEAHGIELVQWGALEWTASGIVLGALLACEHVTTISLCRATPRLMRAEALGLDDYFQPRRLLVGLVVRAIVGATVVFGLSLAGVGIVLCLPWLHATYYAADQDCGPLDALLNSWKAAKRNAGLVLLFELGALVTLIAGLFVCGVGVVGAYVVVTASRAACYEIARLALNR